MPYISDHWVVCCCCSGSNTSTNGANKSANGGNPSTSDANPSTNGANPTTSGGRPEEQTDAESLEDREFRQAVQARRKSPLDASSSYRSTASSDDSSDPDNSSNSPGAPADKAKSGQKRTGRQVQQQFSRSIRWRSCTLAHSTAGLCVNWFAVPYCLIHSTHCLSQHAATTSWLQIFWPAAQPSCI